MTPLVAAATFHGKDRGLGAAGGSLSVSPGVSASFELSWHQLNSRDGGKRKLAAESVRGLPGRPHSTHPLAHSECPFIVSERY